MMRQLRQLPHLPILALGLALGALAPPAGSADLNVVFMMADDLGWNDVGYHGSDIRTPNIDSIAERGVRLERYYATPLCSPTRAAFLTGRLPLRYGVDRPIEGVGSLSMEERLLPEILRAAGYQTAMAGKWHLGLSHVSHHPHNRGFDSAYGHLGPAVDYWTHIWEGGLDWHRNGEPISEEGYSTALIGEEAERVIRDRDTGRPLFLYVAFNAPHAPLQAPPATVARYESLTNPNRRTYAAMVEELDTAVGGIVDALKESEMLEDTLVVWCSDNGGAVRIGADNSPLRDGKGGVFEGGIRVPAVVWKPGDAEGGRTVDQMVTAVDWLPTILDAAGVEPADQRPLDGVNAWPAIARGERVDRPAPYIVGVFRNVAVIDGPWKYVEALPRGGSQLGEHLYRLDIDPGESQNLAEEHPEKLSELRKVMREFPRADTVSPNILEPGARRRRAAGGAPGKTPRRGPGRGAGPPEGWKEITREPWAKSARRD